MTLSNAVPDLEIWYQHRVSYGETDTMGVLYYAEYFHIFERSRNEVIRAVGLPYSEVEKRGFYLPVAEAQCRYRAPARYDDLLQLRTVLGDWRAASVVFRYELYNESRDRLLAEGMTRHAFVNAGGRPVPIPGWFRELFIKSSKGAQAQSRGG